jgi:hypothetical protein
MKPTTLRLALVTSLLAIGALAAATARAEDWTEGMKQGKATFKSMGPLAFGPDGIVFVADTRSAAVVAIATGDTAAPKAQAASANGSSASAEVDRPLKIDAINQKVAALLGTAADQILINDMAVNPASKNVYLAVARGRGPDATPVLIRVNGADAKLDVVSLDDVKFSVAQLPDPPADRAAAGGGGGRGQQNPRQESITDIAFFQDRVIVAGLSNEEFSSTLRAMPFPFKTVANGTTVEIYHGAHGRFETRAPVRTLVPMNIGNQPYVLAAYTCTPLVQFPVNELKPGAKVKGKTVAELGNRNRPLDMIVYQKDGKDYLLLSNSSRGVMKISADGIHDAIGIDEPVRDGGQKGLPVQSVADWTNVDQLDRLDAGHAVVLRKADNGGLTLESKSLP